MMAEKKCAVKSDWRTLEMPARHSEYYIKRHFSEKQMECLRFGHVPEEMEDKWFWYMEGQKLYAHRSWTGICDRIVYNSHVLTIKGESMRRLNAISE